MLVIILDEYSNENESEVNGIKQEIRNIWEYCDLIWDLRKEEKQRIDQIQLSLRDKTREQINKKDSDMPNIDGYYPSIPNISFHSSHGHKTQNIEEDTCYTPTAQLEQLLTTLKEENCALLNAKNRLTENNNITEERNKQLAEENDSLSKEIREKSIENKALKERIITILERAFSAIPEENSKMKTSDWKLGSYSNKSRSNYGELKGTPQTI